jgi:hypothetical protein
VSAQRCAVRMPDQADASSYCLCSTCTPLCLHVQPERIIKRHMLLRRRPVLHALEQRGQLHTQCLSADRAMRWAQPHANSRSTGRDAQAWRSQAMPPMHGVSDTRPFRDDQNINNLAHPAVARHRAFVLGLHCGRPGHLHHLAGRHGHLRGARSAYKRSTPAQGWEAPCSALTHCKRGLLSSSRCLAAAQAERRRGSLERVHELVVCWLRAGPRSHVTRNRSTVSITGCCNSRASTMPLQFSRPPVG